MNQLHERYEQSFPTSFSVPNDVVTREYCTDSGGIPTEACRKDPRQNRIETGYFSVGSEPTEYCDCHVLVDYDVVLGGVSLGDCTKENIEQVGLIRVDRSFPKQIYITDAQYVWQPIADDILPETAPALPFFQNMIVKGDFVGISKTDEQYNRLCRAHFDYAEWRRRQNE